jgi:hypothetical protein
MTSIGTPVVDTADAIRGFIVLVMLILWMVPSVIARRRRLKNFWKLLVCDVLFGMSPIGWVILMFWACSGTQRPAPVITLEAA